MVAFVLSIVLVLAIAPDSELFCSLWCHHVAPAMVKCHEQSHSSASPGVSDDSCARMAAAAATLITENLRRLSNEGARHAVVVPRFQASAQQTGAPQSLVLRPATPFDGPLLLLTLRI